MAIDENGRRQYFNVRIMDVRPGDSVQIGYWDPDGIHAIGSEAERENYLYKSIEQKKFIISTKVVRTSSTFLFLIKLPRVSWPISLLTEC